MPDRDERMAPIDLLARFATCPNFPKDDPLALQFLAQAFVAAENKTGIAREEIVQRCIELSKFCPAENDVLTVASEIAAERIKRRDQHELETQQARWRKEYGSPEKFDWIKEAEKVVRQSRKKREELHRMNLEIYAALGAHTPQEIARLSLHQIFTKQHELGYPLTREQKAYL